MVPRSLSCLQYCGVATQLMNTKEHATVIHQQWLWAHHVHPWLYRGFTAKDKKRRPERKPTANIRLTGSGSWLRLPQMASLCLCRKIMGAVRQTSSLWRIVVFRSTVSLPWWRDYGRQELFTGLLSFSPRHKAECASLLKVTRLILLLSSVLTKKMFMKMFIKMYCLWLHAGKFHYNKKSFKHPVVKCWKKRLRQTQ